THHAVSIDTCCGDLDGSRISRQGSGHRKGHARMPSFPVRVLRCITSTPAFPRCGRPTRAGGLSPILSPSNRCHRHTKAPRPGNIDASWPHNNTTENGRRALPRFSKGLGVTTSKAYSVALPREVENVFVRHVVEASR